MDTQCIKCLDHGSVELIETEEDDRLTRYLVQHGHNTPLEFCQVAYYMKMPIFVARQLVRHRTASINEVSYRYVTASRQFYLPAKELCTKQSKTNKQGSSDEIVDDPDSCLDTISKACNQAFDAYQSLLESGMSAERSRIVLPLATYTEWYWQNDLHNTIHLLKLRLDKHAQYETRVYAQAMLDLIRPVFGTALQAAGL